MRGKDAHGEWAERAGESLGQERAGGLGSREQPGAALWGGGHVGGQDFPQAQGVGDLGTHLSAPAQT